MKHVYGTCVWKGNLYFEQLMDPHMARVHMVKILWYTSRDRDRTQYMCTTVRRCTPAYPMQPCFWLESWVVPISMLVECASPSNLKANLPTCCKIGSLLMHRGTFILLTVRPFLVMQTISTFPPEYRCFNLAAGGAARGSSSSGSKNRGYSSSSSSRSNRSIAARWHLWLQGSQPVHPWQTGCRIFIKWRPFGSVQAPWLSMSAGMHPCQCSWG